MPSTHDHRGWVIDPHRAPFVQPVTLGRTPAGENRAALAFSRSRIIEESELGRVGSFELDCPLLKILSLDRRRARRALIITNLKAPPKLFDRHFEIVQFHCRAKRPRNESELVPLLACPKTVLHDHTLAQRQQLLGETPESVL